LIIAYLPIFSGNEARPFWDFACVFKRVLLKGNRALKGVYLLNDPEDTGEAGPKL
jgi:hypothetical protein